MSTMHAIRLLSIQNEGAREAYDPCGMPLSRFRPFVFSRRKAGYRNAPREEEPQKRKRPASRDGSRPGETGAAWLEPAGGVIQTERPRPGPCSAESGRLRES